MVGPGLHTGLHHGLAIEPVGADTVEDNSGLLRHLEQGGGVTAVTQDQGNWGENMVRILSVTVIMIIMVIMVIIIIMVIT